MAFKGTKRRSALRIAEEIEDVGGYINAYTSREMTAYYARVLQGDVALALDVIGDIVLNPAFDPKEIEVERHVILQEIGQSLDTPDDIIFDWLHEVSYPDQPFGRTILGPEERVSAFRKADFEGFTGALAHELARAIPAGWAVSRTPQVGWSLSMVIATYMLPPVALRVIWPTLAPASMSMVLRLLSRPE